MVKHGKYIKKFRQKKRKKLENKALLIYRPNSDFTSFVNKIRLICSQIGYNLLVKEDETNKLTIWAHLGAREPPPNEEK